MLVSLTVPGIAADPSALGQEELAASLDLHGGALPIELPLEAVDGLGFTFLDPESPRALVQVINGCALNDRFWVLAANLTTDRATLILEASDGDITRTFDLPARSPGGRVDPVVGLAALPICDAFAESDGGFAPLSGTARFSGVGTGCEDAARAVSLIPRTKGTGFGEVRLDGEQRSRVILSEPVAVLDESGSSRSLMLFAESRLPGNIEGVMFSGSARLLPERAVLERRLDGITDGRVRRAFEHAVNGGTPQPLMDELGLRQVRCVHHVSLDFADVDAADRLFLAGWLKEDPEFADTATDESDSNETDQRAPPADAEDDRFIIETIDSEGRLGEIPLLAGPSRRESSIRTWTFQDDESLGQVIDACALTGSYWGLVGSLTESGFEATFLDLARNESNSYQVSQALGGSLAPAVADAEVFVPCA
jgi:hypothetical protein